MANGIYNNSTPIPGNGADRFGDKLVGNQFTDGTSQFTLGNFDIYSNIAPKDSRDFSLGNFSEPITLETLHIENISESKLFASNRLEVFINFDRSKVTNFTLYGSLRERLKVAVQNVIKRFPAAILFNSMRTWSDYKTGTTAINIAYEPDDDETFIDLNLYTVYNPFSLEFTTGDLLVGASDSVPIRNLGNSFLQYSLYINNKEYPLTFLVPTTGNTETGTLQIAVKGKPFSGNSTTTSSFYIKPNTVETEKAFDGLQDVEKFLVERATTPIYTATFDQPRETESGNLIKSTTSITWPTGDKWNIRITGDLFEAYLDKLYDVGDSFDKYKTNLISRFLTTAAFKEFDTYDEKVDKILKIYGRSFDEVKKYIDGLAYMTNVTYDSKNNIPNELIKNFARTLGWSTPSAIKDEGFLESIFKRNPEKQYAGQGENQTPAELDTELYRRLLMNTAYLFKSKGTRRGIEFMLRFIGAPQALIEFNENIYLAGQRINMSKFNAQMLKISGGTYTEEVPVKNLYFSAITNTYPPMSITGFSFGYKTLTKTTTARRDLYPVDKKGYPVTPKYGPDAYFQAGAGWFEETIEHRGKRIIDYDKSVFTGNDPITKTKLNQFTYGEPYLDLYRKFPDSKLGFSIVRTHDNKKSWVTQDSPDSRYYGLSLRGTQYETAKDKLVINVKNVELFLNVGQGLEWDVWNYSRQYGCPFGPHALSAPYPGYGGPDWTKVLIDASKVSFFEFANKFWRVLVNVKNRLTIDDGHAGGYPTLLMVYLNYLKSDLTCGTASNNYTYEKMIEYVEKLGEYWMRLIEQFIPATTIWTGGVKYENSIFHQDKFVYKHEPLCDDTECFGSFVTCCAPIMNDILVEAVTSCGGLSFTGATWQNQITLGGQQYTGNIYYSSTTLYDIPGTQMWLDDMVTILSGITQDTTDPNHLLNYYLINNITDPNIPDLTDPNCVIVQGPCGTGEPICDCPSGYTFSATSVGDAHGICVGPEISGATVPYTNGCQLPDNSLFVTPTGELLYNVPVPGVDDVGVTITGIGGFRFDVEPATVVTSVGSGDWTSTGGVLGVTGGTTVIGTGSTITTCISGGCGTLGVINSTVPITGITNITFINCCTFTGTSVCPAHPCVGCTDVTAINYDANATVNCGCEYDINFIPTSATTTGTTTLTAATTCVTYPAGQDVWNVNNGIDPHYFKSEICLNIQTVEVVPIPNTTDIYAFYDTTSTPNIAGIQARSALESWINDPITGIKVTSGFLGNLYHIPVHDEKWVRWGVLPISGGTFDTPTCLTWQQGNGSSIPQFAVLPPGATRSWSGTLGLDTNQTGGVQSITLTGGSPDALVLNFIDESGGDIAGGGSDAYYDSRNDGSCRPTGSLNGAGSPPRGMYSDWTQTTDTGRIQPTPQYWSDFTAFTEAHTAYNSFKGFIYPIIFNDNNARMMFPLHVYGALYSGTVSPSQFVDNPTVVAAGGTLSAITFSNPYSALTATNTSTGYVGAGLNNFGWGAVFDLGVTCTPSGTTCGDGVYPGCNGNAVGNCYSNCPDRFGARPCHFGQLPGNNNIANTVPSPCDDCYNCGLRANACTDPGTFFSSGAFTSALTAFLEGSATFSINTCQICLPVCYGEEVLHPQTYWKGLRLEYGMLVIYNGIIYQYLGDFPYVAGPTMFDGWEEYWEVYESAAAGIPFLGGNNFTEGDNCEDFEEIIIPTNPAITGETITTNPVIFKEGIFNVGAQDCFESRYIPCIELIDPCACTTYWSDENHHNLYDLNTPVCCPEDSSLNSGQSFILGAACTPPQTFPYTALCVGHGDCECPEGYTYDPMTEVCSIYAVVTATTSPTTVVSGDTNGAYGDYGGRFCIPGSYTTCWNPANPLEFNIITGLPFWGTGGGVDGRLNKIGVWGNPPIDDVWVGFSTCITAATAGQYLIGVAGDNQIRFALDGVQLVENPYNASTTSDRNFKYWWVWPINLSAGEHSIVLQGRNNGATDASFGCEITGPWPIGTFTVNSDFNYFGTPAGVSDYTGRTIFRSIEVTGGTFNTETNLCPDGFEYDICRDTCVDSFPCITDTVTQDCWVPCESEDVTIATNDPTDPCNPDTPVFPEPAICGCEQTTIGEGGTTSQNIDLDFYSITQAEVPQEVLDFYLNEEEFDATILWTVPASTNTTPIWRKAIMNPCCLGDIFKIHFNQYHFDVSGALIETYDAGVYDVLINDNTQIEFYRAIIPGRGPRFYMHLPCVQPSCMVLIYHVTVTPFNTSGEFSDASTLTLQLGGVPNDTTLFFLQKVNDSTYLTDNGTASNNIDLGAVPDRYWYQHDYGDSLANYGALTAGEMRRILRGVNNTDITSPWNVAAFEGYTYNMEIEVACKGVECSFLQFNVVEREGDVTNPCPTNRVASRVSQTAPIVPKEVNITETVGAGNVVELFNLKDVLYTVNPDLNADDYVIDTTQLYLVENTRTVVGVSFNWNTPIAATTTDIPTIDYDAWVDTDGGAGKPPAGLPTSETFISPVTGRKLAALSWMDQILKNNKNEEVEIKFVNKSNQLTFAQALPYNVVGQGAEPFQTYKGGNVISSYSTYANLDTWLRRSIGDNDQFYPKEAIYRNGIFDYFLIQPVRTLTTTNSQYITGVAPIANPKTDFIVTTEGSWSEFLTTQSATTVSALTSTYSGYTNLSGYTNIHGQHNSPDAVFNLTFNSPSLVWSNYIPLSDRIHSPFNFNGSMLNYIPAIPLESLTKKCGPVEILRKENEYSTYVVSETGMYNFHYKTNVDVSYSDEGWCSYLQENYWDFTDNGYPSTNSDYFDLFNTSILRLGGNNLSSEIEGTVANEKLKKRKMYVPAFGFSPGTGLDFDMGFYIQRILSGTTSATTLAQYSIKGTEDDGAADAYMSFVVNPSDEKTSTYSCSGTSATTVVFTKQFTPYLDTGCVKLDKGDTIVLKGYANWESTTKFQGTGTTATTLSVIIGSDKNSNYPYFRGRLCTNTTVTENKGRGVMYLYWNPDVSPLPAPVTFVDGRPMEGNFNNPLGTLNVVTSPEDVDKTYLPPTINASTFYSLPFVDIPTKDYRGPLSLIPLTKPSNIWVQAMMDNKIDGFNVNALKMVDIIDGRVIWNTPVPTTIIEPIDADDDNTGYSDSVETLELEDLASPNTNLSLNDGSGDVGNPIRNVTPDNLYDPRYTLAYISAIRIKGSKDIFNWVGAITPQVKTPLNYVAPTPPPQNEFNNMSEHISVASSSKLEDRTIDFQEGQLIIGEKIVNMEPAAYSTTTPTTVDGSSRVTYCKCGENKFLPIDGDSVSNCQQWCCAFKHNDYYPCSEKTGKTWAQELGNINIPAKATLITDKNELKGVVRDSGVKYRVRYRV